MWTLFDYALRRLNDGWVTCWMFLHVVSNCVFIYFLPILLVIEKSFRCKAFNANLWSNTEQLNTVITIQLHRWKPNLYLQTSKWPCDIQLCPWSSKLFCNNFWNMLFRFELTFHYFYKNDEMVAGYWKISRYDIT